MSTRSGGQRVLQCATRSCRRQATRADGPRPTRARERLAAALRGSASEQQRPRRPVKVAERASNIIVVGPQTSHAAIRSRVRARSPPGPARAIAAHHPRPRATWCARCRATASASQPRAASRSCGAYYAPSSTKPACSRAQWSRARARSRRPAGLRGRRGGR